MISSLFLINEIDIVYRPLKEIDNEPRVTSPDEAYKIFRQSWDDTKICLREEFKVMLLNRTNRVLGISTVATGGIAGVFVDPKIIFAIALKAAASSIILAHNHPSGAPSKRIGVIHNKLVYVRSKHSG
ncbi:MAG: hypothetical protein MI749_11610 [Desulfovibrionales bacterium]|nr:hypothetical protein [Desulfovibrionales bacterium]